MSNKFNVQNLVFEGGGAKGLAYLGVLKALEEVGIYKEHVYQVQKVAGTSAGAISALLVCLDYSPKNIQEIFDSLGNMDDLFEVTISYIKNIPDPRKNPFEFLGYLAVVLGNYAQNNGGINKGDKFKNHLRSWIEKSPYGSKLIGSATFNDLKKVTNHDLYVYGTRLFNDTIADFNPEETGDFSIVDAVCISMSIPFLFSASVLPTEKEYYVDGGVLFNFPITFDDKDAIINHQTLGFSLHKNDEKLKFPDETDTMFSKLYYQMRALVEDAYNVNVTLYKKHEQETKRVVYIDTSFVGMLDFEMDPKDKAKLIQNGYDATMSHLQ